MGDYRFFYPIEIRYGDIDAQRHLNNARYFTLMEQARIHYLMMLGLWDATDFDQIGIILAEQACTYLEPITLQHEIEVGVRTERMGSKSIEMRYCLRDVTSHQELATGSSILVAYDYQLRDSITIPASWREIIEGFESDSSSGAYGKEDTEVDPE
jgi:acyl-CoA thioester hydrolase